jgi:hypothetical protein
MSLFHQGPQPPTPIRYDSLNVGSSLMDLPVVIFWGQRRLSTNAIWYGDFKHHPVNGKGKGGGAKAQQAYDYTAATILALCEGPLDSVARAWAAGSTTTTSSLSQLNMTLFLGTASQAPWSWMESNYPDQARAYALTAYLGCPNQDLGESATIPDNAFECVRANGFAYTHTTPGWIDPNSHDQASAIDVLLSDCIRDLLTNVQYGALMAAADLGDMSQYAAYLQAQGLFHSPLLTSLEKANSVLDRWAQLSNSWIYWSGADLQFVPLGDAALSANGATYTPQTDVAYNLTLNDFVFESGEPPVKVSRKDPADCANRTIVNITDRTIGYTSNPLEYKDDSLVGLYGLRDNENIQADEVCDPIVGNILKQLLGKRAAYIRNSYSFKTSFRYVLVLPGTILTLTEPNIGLNQVRVRVTTVKRNDKRQLEFTAEEFPGNIGTYVAPSASVVANIPTYPNEFIDPGPVNTPAVAEPNSDFSATPKLLIAASGGANWGGCVVNISFDGTSYSQIGTIAAPAPQGTLTAVLASHADPDTTDTLAVDCTESLTTPVAVTTADADALRSLALVAAQPTVSGGIATLTPGELLAFGDVTATGTYTANLTYLRRGAYGTAPAAHAIGAQFTVIDTLGETATTLAYDLPAQYVGQTIYLKLASFNAFGNATEDLSTVQEYAYVPTGVGYGAGTAGVPTQPSGLTATGAPGEVQLVWSANPATDNVTSYSLRRATGASAPFSSAVQIWQGLTLGYIDTGVAASTEYTYYLVANNAVGASAPSTGQNATTGAGAYDPAGSAAAAAGAAQAAAETYAAGYFQAHVAPPCAVSALPTPVAGLRGFVTDSTVALSPSTVGNIVAGGGTHGAPVWADNSNWYLG